MFHKFYIHAFFFFFFERRILLKARTTFCSKWKWNGRVVIKLIFPLNRVGLSVFFVSQQQRRASLTFFRFALISFLPRVAPLSNRASILRKSRFFIVIPSDIKFSHHFSVRLKKFCKIVDWNRGGRECRDFELSQIENFCWNRVEFQQGGDSSWLENVELVENFIMQDS